MKIMIKNTNLNFRLILGGLFFFLSACGPIANSEEVTEKDGVITIKIDVDNLREASLSEFFEPEIDYLLLKESEDPGSQIGEIAKLIEYKDMIFVFDWWIGKSVQMFDRQGNFIHRIRNLGDGLGKYIELADLQVVQDTVYLLAHPLKIIKFDLEGNFLDEFKIPVTGRTFHYDTDRKSFFVYHGSDAENLVSEINHAGMVLGSFFPRNPSIFYGIMSDPVNFYTYENGFYFTRTYTDTLYTFNQNSFEPLMVFDFGKLAMDHTRMIEKKLELDNRAFSDYFKENSGSSYAPYGFSNSKYILSRLRMPGFGAVSIFDKINKKHHLVKFDLRNDIDESFNFYPPVYQLQENRVAIAYRGPSLYNKAVEKKQTMSEQEWQDYQQGKGKDFIEAAFYGKETENYVLMILKTKK